MARASSLMPLYKHLYALATEIIDAADSQRGSRYGSLADYKNCKLAEVFVEASKAALKRRNSIYSLNFALAAGICGYNRECEASINQYTAQLIVDIANTIGIRPKNAESLAQVAVDYITPEINNTSQPSREAVLTVFENAMVQLRKNGVDVHAELKSCEELKLPEDMMLRAKRALLNINVAPAG